MHPIDISGFTATFHGEPAVVDVDVRLEAGRIGFANCARASSGAAPPPSTSRPWPMFIHVHVMVMPQHHGHLAARRRRLSAAFPGPRALPV